MGKGLEEAAMMVAWPGAAPSVSMGEAWSASAGEGQSPAAGVVVRGLAAAGLPLGGERWPLPRISGYQECSSVNFGY